MQYLQLLSLMKRDLEMYVIIIESIHTFIHTVAEGFEKRNWSVKNMNTTAYRNMFNRTTQLLWRLLRQSVNCQLQIDSKMRHHFPTLFSNEKDDNINCYQKNRLRNRDCLSLKWFLKSVDCVQCHFSTRQQHSKTSNASPFFISVSQMVNSCYLVDYWLSYLLLTTTFVICFQCSKKKCACECQTNWETIVNIVFFIWYQRCMKAHCTTLTCHMKRLWLGQQVQ